MVSRAVLRGGENLVITQSEHNPKCEPETFEIIKAEQVDRKQRKNIFKCNSDVKGDGTFALLHLRPEHLRPYICAPNICAPTFALRTFAPLHLRSEHLRPYICAPTFAPQTFAPLHLRPKHLRPYICAANICAPIANKKFIHEIAFPKG
ncbi:hypothetical protein niasHT_015201 [Heterodera trifolii]|uniref:C2H2-type domain-containing protein n=1 Tax=Heterodera trifolii TaxID=157864 RepID=A0ABD2L2A3_9BILA